MRIQRIHTADIKASHRGMPRHSQNCNKSHACDDKSSDTWREQSGATSAPRIDTVDKKASHHGMPRQAYINKL